MSEKKTDPGGGMFLLGLMLGGAVGAAIGLLYAPRPGAQSRRELADWAEGMREAEGQSQGDQDADAGDQSEPAKADLP